MNHDTVDYQLPAIKASVTLQNRSDYNAKDVKQQKSCNNSLKSCNNYFKSCNNFFAMEPLLQCNMYFLTV